MLVLQSEGYVQSVHFEKGSYKKSIGLRIFKATKDLYNIHTNPML